MYGKNLENLHLRCRTCLNECLGYKYDIEEMSISLFKLLQHCIVDEENPEEEFFPNLLCEPCLDKLKSFEEFQLMSRKSTKLLKEFLKSQRIITTASQQEEHLIFEEILIKEGTSEDENLSELNECFEIKTDHMHLHQGKISILKKTFRVQNHIPNLNEGKLLEMECNYDCGETFRQFSTAKKHNHSKHKYDGDLDLSTNKSLGKSQQIVDNEVQKEENACFICQRTFISLAGLKKHMLLHQKEDKLYCNQCELDFERKIHLKNHIRDMHSNNPVEIICKYGCGKKFHRQKTATEHYHLKHISSDLTSKLKDTNISFICENCGHVFNSISKLRKHRYFHRPPEERPFKCDQCNKTFIVKRNYTEHLMRHTGIKTSKCPYCGIKKFNNRELQAHINCHTKEKQFQCELCQKVFGRKFNLNKHKDTVHYGIRKYSCRYCDQSFGEAGTLKFHEMIHTGERPHKCTLCDRSFRQPKLLSRHLKTHKK